MERYILSIDQGTTSSRALVVNKKGEIIFQSQKEFTQYFPQPGWVEHDPMEIWESVLNVVREALAFAGPTSIEAIGITNQRETTVVWEKSSGKPIYNAIVWQSRQTASICQDVVSKGHGPLVKEKTGLVIDAYFSATKIQWILDHVPLARERASHGELCFGTIDSWILWNLTQGKSHATDYSNASRTMVFNIHTLEWDAELLDVFHLPKEIFPEVKPSSGLFGYAKGDIFPSDGIAILGMAGDQQAALFGQNCFYEGLAKNTYGTGCFMLMHTGKVPVPSAKGLLTTIAWGLNDEVEYALEGSVFVAGSAVQWLRDGLHFFEESHTSEALARSVEDSDGVYVVPAFVGMGTPYWNMDAKGAILGITRGTTPAHITRATLESIAFQVMEVLETMKLESNLTLETLRVDGGATQNELLMQFQSDLLQVPIETTNSHEITALGAAYLAGLGSGFWSSLEELAQLRQKGKVYIPQKSKSQMENHIKGWQRAIAATLAFANYGKV